MMREEWEEGALYPRRGWKSSVNSTATTVHYILPFDTLTHTRYPSPLRLNLKMPTHQNVSIPLKTENTSTLSKGTTQTASFAISNLKSSHTLAK